MGHKSFEDGVIDILTWPLNNSHNGVTAENVANRSAGPDRHDRLRNGLQTGTALAVDGISSSLLGQPCLQTDRPGHKAGHRGAANRVTERG